MYGSWWVANFCSSFEWNLEAIIDIYTSPHSNVHAEVQEGPEGKGLKWKDMVEGNGHAELQEGPQRERLKRKDMVEGNVHAKVRRAKREMVEMKGHGGRGRLQHNDAM